MSLVGKELDTPLIVATNFPDAPSTHDPKHDRHSHPYVDPDPARPAYAISTYQTPDRYASGGVHAEGGF
jgi:hypothetical protein